ncbi:MAG: DUF559 domain-containing protein [Acidobacteria bacterium]|nr:DUF559 domain-containing protein [Acidobacteriota bacterium]
MGVDAARVSELLAELKANILSTAFEKRNTVYINNQIKKVVHEWATARNWRVEIDFPLNRTDVRPRANYLGIAVFRGDGLYPFAIEIEYSNRRSTLDKLEYCASLMMIPVLIRWNPTKIEQALKNSQIQIIRIPIFRVPSRFRRLIAQQDSGTAVAPPSKAIDIADPKQENGLPLTETCAVSGEKNEEPSIAQSAADVQQLDYKGLKRRIIDEASRIFSAIWLPKLAQEMAVGGSPPEELLALVLEVLLWEETRSGRMRIEKQKKLEGEFLTARYFQPDFIIEQTSSNAKFIIECDGYTYHRRTPEEYSREIKREREILKQGYPVVRFSAAELFEDPWGAGLEVIDFIRKKLLQVDVPNNLIQMAIELSRSSKASKAD